MGGLGLFVLGWVGWELNLVSVCESHYSLPCLWQIVSNKYPPPPPNGRNFIRRPPPPYHWPLWNFQLSFILSFKLFGLRGPLPDLNPWNFQFLLWGVGILILLELNDVINRFLRYMTCLLFVNDRTD